MLIVKNDRTPSPLHAIIFPTLSSTNAENWVASLSTFL